MVLWLLACSSPAPRGEAVLGDGDEQRIVRLTHLQWENAVVDLLGLSEPTGLSDGFVPDGAGSTFDNDAAFLSVTPTLWQQYQAAAETLGQRVADEDALFDAVAPRGSRRRDPWIDDFGLRAFRRPLTEPEHAAFAALFDRGPELFGTGDDFRDGVHAGVVGFLQAPAFVYRSEGLDGAPARNADLSPHELAARLSFALWNTIPDEPLRAAADAGLGADTVTAEVRRMLDAPAAHAMVADLHRQLLHVDNYEHIHRPPEEVLGIDAFEGSIPAAMQREAYAFVDAVVFGGGTVRDLLTSRRSFANDRLAELYGVSVEGDALVPVQLDASERAGLLTLSGFLASHADRGGPNLIARGGFVNEALLCVDVPAPPSDVPALPPDPEHETTLRERIDHHTSTCGGACHTQMINPIGFALGKYDQEGRYVTVDNGAPIDATGTYRFEDGSFSYDGAVELAGVLADRPQVHRCYVSHLVSYLEGRPPTADDADRIDELTEASLDDRPIRDLVADIVSAEAFRRLRE